MISNMAKKIAGFTDSKSLGWAIAQVLDLRGLSRELVAAITDRAAKQKDILVDVMAKELSAFLSRINITEEAQKILEGATLDVRATLSFGDKKKTEVQRVIGFGGRKEAGKRAKK